MLARRRFEAAQGYECMTELQEATRRSHDDVIKAWTKFVGVYLSHILRRPLAIYQLASQQVSCILHSFSPQQFNTATFVCCHNVSSVCRLSGTRVYCDKTAEARIMSFH